MTSEQVQIKYAVCWRYGANGEPLERVFVREAAARKFRDRMYGFRHHTLGKPRGLRIEVRREIGAGA